ncbi:hypothetical protein FisN_10Hh062 [Fistulifera solaris]|uniref:NYN domain-containing protein n=1 Tax=Fistulifera solaris TaxID=1519565 RepID=A0A1Z5K5P8_FISSO|nr:hypothetical protein FisN_10Hh062 [Fistulifera solaris]|eukprot:GAX21482.1 hypothetical protein FisN_10Hh062 [Fistulifera solaris]
MRCPMALLLEMALALQRERTTWYIDGHNLLGHKGTPRSVEALIQALEPIQGVEKIALILDSKLETDPLIQIQPCDNNVVLETVTLSRDISADDYIRQQIHEALPHTRIQVVTADRDLRRQVLQTKPVVRGVVNPVTFWRRYLPRLCGYKKPKQ